MHGTDTQALTRILPDEALRRLEVYITYHVLTVPAVCELFDLARLTPAVPSLAWQSLTAA